MADGGPPMPDLKTCLGAAATTSGGPSAMKLSSLDAVAPVTMPIPTMKSGAEKDQASKIPPLNEAANTAIPSAMKPQPTAAKTARNTLVPSKFRRMNISPQYLETTVCHADRHLTTGLFSTDSRPPPIHNGIAFL